MTRAQLALVLLALLAAACGDGSGVDSSKKVSDLSEGEIQQICEWGIDLQGGPRQITCGETSITLDVAGCVESMKKELEIYETCSLTVGQLEACSEAQADEIRQGKCPDSFNYAACQPVAACYPI